MLGYCGRKGMLWGVGPSLPLPLPLPSRGFPTAPASSPRDSRPFSLQDWLQAFSYGGCGLEKPDLNPRLFQCYPVVRGSLHWVVFQGCWRTFEAGGCQFLLTALHPTRCWDDMLVVWSGFEVTSMTEHL